MNELQQVVEDVEQALDSTENYGSPVVGISRSEAKVLIDAAKLVPLLQERCQLLGRALDALWSVVGEEEQREIADLLDVPAGDGKTALTLAQMLERKGAAMEEVA